MNRFLKNRPVRALALALLALATMPSPASAQNGEDELMKIPEASPGGRYRASEGFNGLENTSIGMYGEVIYNNELGTSGDEIDARRFVLFVAHEFSEQWRFFTEIEIEHADEIFIEQGFLDFQPSEALGFQAGVLLIPLGIINPIHEPTTFFFAERPFVASALIPTTFRENGIQAYGSFGMLSYQLGVVNSAKPPSMSALMGIPTGGIRFIRQKGSHALADDFAIMGRVDVTPTAGFTAGVGFYSGEWDQDNSGVVADSDARLTIVDLHARLQLEQFEIRGVWVANFITDADELNAAGGVDTVPSFMTGGYIEAAYDFLPHILPDTNQQLFFAVRAELLDLHADMPSNGVKDPRAERQIYNFGLAWKPLPGVIVKADYQLNRDDVEGFDKDDFFNAAVGFNF